MKHLRRRPSIYKTARPPFWHTQIYEAKAKTNVVRPAKQTSRGFAADVADEIIAHLRAERDPTQVVSKARSFEHFVRRCTKVQTGRAKTKRQQRTLGDHGKLLDGEGDGLEFFIRKHGRLAELKLLLALASRGRMPRRLWIKPD